MARIKNASEKGNNKNSAVVSMASPKEIIIEKIVEVPVERVVEKIVEKEVASVGPVTFSRDERVDELMIKMKEIEGFQKFITQHNTEQREELVGATNKLQSQMEAKDEEINDMMESLSAKMDISDSTNKAALLVLNSQIGQLGKELERQMKVNIGLGILLITTIVIGLII